MGYRESVKEVEDQLFDALESNTTQVINSGRVFAGSLADKKNPEKSKNILTYFKNAYTYDFCTPSEVPIVKGEPYGLGLGMALNDDFDADDFDAMIDELWDQAKDYEQVKKEAVDNITERKTNTPKKYFHRWIVLPIGEIIGKNIVSGILFPKVTRAYRIDDDSLSRPIRVNFLEGDKNNAIYLNTYDGDITEYEGTIDGGKRIAEYLDSR